jgi:hypothetical protein
MNRVHLIFAGLMLVMPLGALDATIRATALPTIVRARRHRAARMAQWPREQRAEITAVLNSVARILVPDGPSGQRLDQERSA